MKVTDVMQKYVEFIAPEDSVLQAARLIFGRGINGLPVCRNKKVVGFITERDILSKFYPSVQEYIEDPFHSSDFEGMENKVSEILSFKVEEIMSKNPIVITADAPLLKAHSLMRLNKVGRIPVVDNKDNLVGIVSNGDIFKAIVGDKVPLEEESGFYEWLGEYYDELYDWKKRLASEIPDLASLFHEEKAVGILDIASSTGEHSIALAKESFQVIGLEASTLMYNLARKKQRNLASPYNDKVIFLKGSYKKNLKNLHNLDAAIFMGNALRPALDEDSRILEDVISALNKNNPILVFQLLNFEKLFKINKGFRDFYITEGRDGTGPKHALLSFYTKNSPKDVFISRAVFSLTGRRWIYRGIRSTPVIPIGEKELILKLKKLGFSKFNFYGSSLYQPIFKYPFKSLESDWFTVIAKR
jgi:CBS domain-containing protein/SAM-dependent methyltransferase